MSIGILYCFEFIMITFGIIFILNRLQLTQNTNVGFKIAFFGSLFFYTGYAVSFMMTLAAAYFHLKAINDFLLKCGDNPENFEVKIILKEISLMHDKLCDVFECISSYFVLIILVFFLGFTYFSVFFYTLFVFFQDSNFKIFNFLLTSLLWVSYFTPSVVWLEYFSSFIEEEGSKTADHIQNLMLHEKSLNILKKLNCFLLQVTHRNPYRISYQLEIFICVDQCNFIIFYHFDTILRCHKILK